MPRYFFHVRNQQGDLKEDPEGQEFADLASVEQDAMAAAKEILAEELLRGKSVLTKAAFEIVDENNALVLRFPFSEAAQKVGTQP
ncbi:MULTISPECIES: DUF6894 family protein [unclassified Mesorhizobium]|uniref:DUF6894 family protein n=1 Tax=unclassified Mesorhizobium TaxID=325217 RepID=UPI001129AF0C|nr:MULTISPECIES: hypothetical protein [unclassified Mesorhizobium]MBZ9739737.1 hypothetical protein [Mesorhizobium sp. CO1-1-4]MBZ9804999.1 hypothetical protein [Mesorhizobium sp. ES1-6]TPL88740.1 hypothetical protein FJ948_21305 [Mesorhizobium sp. B2-3-12]